MFLQDKNKNTIVHIQMACLFLLVTKAIESSWFIREICKLNHNHSFTVATLHPFLRKLYFTSAITSEIEQGIQVNLKLGAIVDLL